MQSADALLDTYQKRRAATTVLRSERFTGEPDASKVCQSGSEGGGWKGLLNRGEYLAGHLPYTGLAPPGSRRTAARRWWGLLGLNPPVGRG